MCTNEGKKKCTNVKNVFKKLTFLDIATPFS